MEETMKRKLMTLILAAGLVWGAATDAKAIEFKASGEWYMGFGGVESTFLDDDNGGNDVFQAMQRIRIQLDAIASENLSGTLQISVGDTTWGQASSGGALGADGIIVAMRSAYIDWYVPNTELQFRMGVFGAATPNAAGGSAILDEQSAGIVANWRLNDVASITAMWLRPLNDNYLQNDHTNNDAEDPSNYLDNVDYFGLSVPLSFEGFEITPWVLVGAVGKNALRGSMEQWENEEVPGGGVLGGFMPIGFDPSNADQRWSSDNAYGIQFFAGLPIIISAFDPVNIEFDVNYGLSTGMGDYTAFTWDGRGTRASADRSGFVLKTLVEYNMDWGRPGLFAWYGSGDDGDISNGSERMPTIVPTSNFTSFMQDGVVGWGINGAYDLMLSYSGTWGVGLQIADMSFVEDLSHTIRVAYWGGTNDGSMMKYAGYQGWKGGEGLYLTHSDHLVEINVDTTWQIYENLQAVVELGYIFNGIDTESWDDATGNISGPAKGDAWKASLMMLYTF